MADSTLAVDALLAQQLSDPAAVHAMHAVDRGGSPHSLASRGGRVSPARAEWRRGRVGRYSSRGSRLASGRSSPANRFRHLRGPAGRPQAGGGGAAIASGAAGGAAGGGGRLHASRRVCAALLTTAFLVVCAALVVLYIRDVTQSLRTMVTVIMVVLVIGLVLFLVPRLRRGCVRMWRAVKPGGRGGGGAGGAQQAGAGGGRGAGGAGLTPLRVSGLGGSVGPGTSSSTRSFNNPHPMWMSTPVGGGNGSGAPTAVHPRVAQLLTVQPAPGTPTSDSGGDNHAAHDAWGSPHTEMSDAEAAAWGYDTGFDDAASSHAYSTADADGTSPFASAPMPAEGGATSASGFGTTVHAVSSDTAGADHDFDPHASVFYAYGAAVVAPAPEGDVGYSVHAAQQQHPDPEAAYNAAPGLHVHVDDRHGQYPTHDTPTTSTPHAITPVLLSPSGEGSAPESGGGGGDDGGGVGAPAPTLPQLPEAPVEAEPPPLSTRSIVSVDDCGICVNPLTDVCEDCETSGKTKCPLASGKCGHVLHRHCLLSWLSTCDTDAREMSCPYCKRPWEWRT